MKKKLPAMLVFIGSLAVFVISVVLFWNMGIYVDEHNTTPAVICGGNFWLAADWLRLAISGIATLASGIYLLRK